MDEALIELQARTAFMDEEIRQLGEVVAMQQKALDEVRAQLARLQELVRTLAPSQVVDLSDEAPPPHY